MLSVKHSTIFLPHQCLMALIWNHLAVWKKKKKLKKKKNLSWLGPEFCAWSFIRIVPGSCMCMCVCVWAGGVQLLGRVRLFARAWLSPPGSSVRGILQTKILERVAIPSLKGSSPPRDQTQICIAGGFFTAEPPGKPHTRHLLASSLSEVTADWWRCCCFLQGTPVLLRSL